MAPFLAENSTGEAPVDSLAGGSEGATFEPVQDLADSMKPVPESVSEETEEEWVYPYPTDFKLTEEPIDEYRDLEVSIVHSK